MKNQGANKLRGSGGLILHCLKHLRSCWCFQAEISQFAGCDAFKSYSSFNYESTGLDQGSYLFQVIISHQNKIYHRNKMVYSPHRIHCASKNS